MPFPAPNYVRAACDHTRKGYVFTSFNWYVTREDHARLMQLQLPLDPVLTHVNQGPVTVAGLHSTLRMIAAFDDTQAAHVEGTRSMEASWAC